MKFSNRRLAAVAAVAVTAGLSLTACGSSNSSTNNTVTPPSTGTDSSAPAPATTSAASGTISLGGKSIVFLPKNLGNPYFDASDKDGGQTAVKAMGGAYSEVGPDTAGPSAQVPFIQTATQQQAGAIVMSADDPSAPCTAIKQAMAAGVKVVTFDSDTSPDCRNVFVNQASPEGIAESQADIIAKEIGGSGQIAILSAAANATNQNLWNKLMSAYIAKKYPNIKIVATVYGNDDDQTSFDQTQALLQKYPTLKGIVSPTTVGIAAAARYLDTSSFKGKVSLTGLGDPAQMKKYVADGTVPQFALWNPSDLGYLAAYAAGALVSGQITGKQGDTFTAGKLGKYTVGADGEILLGKPYVFNKSNIGNFNF
jgi:rhamnose transport system substrate-binding protein